MRATVVQPKLRIAFAGAFAVRLEARAQGIAENIQRVGRGEPPVHLIPSAMT